MANEPEIWERFPAALQAQHTAGRGVYFSFGHIVAALNEVIHPAGAPNPDYPHMVYSNGNRDDEYRIVQDHAEELSAQALGYGRWINPPDPRYPKWKTENPGVYGSRRVILKDEADETQWRAAVDFSKWVDDADHQWGPQIFAGSLKSTTTRQSPRAARLPRLDRAVWAGSKSPPSRRAARGVPPGPLAQVQPGNAALAPRPHPQ